VSHVLCKHIVNITYKLDVYVDLETISLSEFSSISSAFYKYVINVTAKLEVYVHVETTSLSRFNSMYSATCDTDCGRH